MHKVYVDGKVLLFTPRSLLDDIAAQLRYLDIPLTARIHYLSDAERKCYPYWTDTQLLLRQAMTHQQAIVVIQRLVALGVSVV